MAATENGIHGIPGPCQNLQATGGLPAFNDDHRRDRRRPTVMSIAPLCDQGHRRIGERKVTMHKELAKEAYGRRNA